MPKTEPKNPNPPADEIIQQEALRVARATQKPGQTKEQTKLIAQGIAKGIEMYKKQQSAKARERDKQRKRALKLRQAGSEENPETAGNDPEWSPDHEDSGTAAALLAGSALFAAMAAAHLARAFMGWALVVGPWTVPNWASVAAALALAGLSTWFFLKATGR